MGKPKKPWQTFRVGTPGEDNDCQSFDQVWHVTHISNALTIIPQGVIRPQLVYDDSNLNTRRILVNWVSPNYWFHGFRYGNVSFDWSWKKLIRGKNYYWVEVMDYSPKACRILITDQDYADDSDLTPYDPTDGDGPWWFDESEDTHYWNGTFCLEFMLEFELSIPACKTIGLVDHHPQYCCMDPASCPDMDLHQHKAAARLLAGIISQDTDVSDANLDQAMLDFGWWFLAQQLPQKGYIGDVGAKDKTAHPLARAVACALYNKRTAESRSLASLFYNRAALHASLFTLAQDKFPQLEGSEPGPIDEL